MEPLSSMLPELEPVLGAALALNVAYLGLDRFRYRRKIREETRKEMGDMVDTPPSEDENETFLFRSVLRLSSLPDHDRKLFRRSNNADLSGAWSTIYEWYFECHQDIIATITLGFISGLLLLGGVAHKIDMKILVWLFTKDYINWWFALCVIAMALPVISVLVGRYTVARALSFAQRQIGDIKRLKKNAVAQVKPPADDQASSGGK